MAKKEESLVKAETQEVTTAIPDFMKDDAAAFSNLGTESIRSGDMTMPRLALAQKMSPQLDQIEDLKPGMFFNTLTSEIYGLGPFLVTPLFARKSRRLFETPNPGSPTLCMSQNGETGGRLSQHCSGCPKASFGFDATKNKTTKPDCTLFWTYIIILHLEGRRFTPIAFSLKSKMLKAAQDWNSYMRMRGMAAFTGVYKLSAFKDNGGGVDFFNVKIENAGILQVKQQYEDAKMLFESLQGKIDNMKIDETGLNEPEHDEEVPF